MHSEHSHPFPLLSGPKMGDRESQATRWRLDLPLARTVLGSEGEGEGDEDEDEDCQQEIRCERPFIVVLRHSQWWRMGPNDANDATPRREFPTTTLWLTNITKYFYKFRNAYFSI